MTRAVKLLHTSDVHLDAYAQSPKGYWAERRRLIQEAFARVVQVAIDERVDLFLIAGDFFDSNRASAEAIEFAIEQLRRVPAPAVILPGNHDCYSADSVYRRVDFERECDNVRVIKSPDGERLTFNGLGPSTGSGHGLALWGKADPGSGPDFAALAGLPPRGRERWYVAIAHADVLLPDRRPWASVHIRPEEIAAADLDYLALGHWEPFEDVSQGSVTAVYSGAPMSLVDGTSGSGWAVIAELREGRSVSIRRVPVAEQGRR